LRAAVVVLFFATTACGSFGAASEPTPDASAPEGGAVDGGLDGGVLDASASDASLDAAVSVCGWPPFTDGFERADLLGAWGAIEPVYGDGLDLVLEAAPVPRGESLQVTAVPSTGNRNRTLARTLGTPLGPLPSCIELELSIYVESFGGSIDANFASIELDDQTGVSLWNDTGDAIALVEQTTNGVSFQEVARVVAAKGAWHHLRVRYTYLPVPVVTFRFDDGDIATTARGITKGRPTQVRVGGGYTQSVTTAKFWIDDVSIH
jgi:hypothetical protein